MDINETLDTANGLGETSTQEPDLQNGLSTEGQNTDVKQVALPSKVKVVEDNNVYYNNQLIALKKGDIVDGALAGFLLENGAAVKVVK